MASPACSPHGSRQQGVRGERKQEDLFYVFPREHLFYRWVITTSDQHILFYLYWFVYSCRFWHGWFSLEQRWGCFKDFLSRALFSKLIFFLFLSKEKGSYFYRVYLLAVVPRELKFCISKNLFSESFFFKMKKLVPYHLLKKFF